MDRRKLLTAGGAAALTAAVAPAAALAEAGNDQGIVGSWFGTVTATNPPLGAFNDLISFLDGGVVVESRRYLVDAGFAKLLETTGHGQWRKTGARTYEAFFRFLLEDATSGAPFGTDNIRLQLTLDRAAQTLAGTFHSDIEDEAGNVQLGVDGTYTAVPITV